MCRTASLCLYDQINRLQAAVLLSLERKYIAKETWLLYLNYAAHRLSSVGITLPGDEGNCIQSYANQVKAGRSDSILSNIPISNPYMDTGHYIRKWTFTQMIFVDGNLGTSLVLFNWVEIVCSHIAIKITLNFKTPSIKASRQNVFSSVPMVEISWYVSLFTFRIKCDD